MSRQSNPRVCVVGAGVVGLSTALHLLETRRDLDVTIISDRSFSEITSYGPIGIFRPSLETFGEREKLWAKTSYERFGEIWRGPEAAQSGVQAVSGYILGDDRRWLETEEQRYGDYAHNFRWLDEDQLEDFSKKFQHGIFYTAFTTQGRRYVPWLAHKVKSLHGKFLRHKVETVSELGERFDLVVNCAGLDAGRLVGDRQMAPIRGMLIEIDAPWIKHFIYGGDDETYIIPARDTVYLGTVRNLGNNSRTARDSDRKDILARCAEVMPSIRSARIVDEWVGLRPYRPEVRLELETVVEGGRRLPVVHNYGHSGNGFTMSWGTAVAAGRLVNEALGNKSRL